MTLRRRIASVAGLLVLLTGCGESGEGEAPSAQATQGTQRQPPEASEVLGTGEGVFGRIPEIVREVEPSVVAVLTDRGEGSGVVWDSDGTIVTNEHVVAGAGAIEVSFADGQRAPAAVVATDPLTDLAVLRAERRGLPAAVFATQLPEVGELAVAIGNPLGFENTVTAGIVSGLHRSIPGSAQRTQALVDLIQTDAPISPGNSGGALVDAEAQVIGISVAFIPPEARAVSIGFAIPSPTVIDVVAQLLDDGTVSHAFFGILPAPLTDQIARRLGVEADAGVVVLEVVAGGPAAAAGLASGDVIVALDGEEVATVEQFLAQVRDGEPGQRVTVTFVRAGEEREVAVVLTDRPPER